MPATSRSRRMDLAKVAFTGKLASMTRREASEHIAAKGGTTSNSIGRETTMLVVGMDGWPLLADGSVSQKLTKAQDLAKRGHRIQIIAEERFLEAIGLRSRKESLRKSYSAEQMCALVGIDADQLRRWEYAGLVHCSDDGFDFQDIVSLKTIAELVGRGVKQETIARSIQQLARILPGTDRPLAQLKLVSEPSGKVLAEVGGALVEPSGQIRLDFEGDQESSQFASAPCRAIGNDLDADGWYAQAVELEEQEQFEESERAYRRAITLAPGMADAHFNLANVLLALNKREAAEERLRVAIEQEPAFKMAWYNLACLQESRGAIEEAIRSLDRAVAIDPLYADAHFNLASCYERVGQMANAAHHWKAYLSLDNSSPWAEQARRGLRQA